MDHSPPAMPGLRQDLKIIPPEPGSAQSQLWTLHDPVNNRYFRVGKIAMAVLKHWDTTPETIVEKAAQAGVEISMAQVTETLEFLGQNHLLQAREPQRLYNHRLKSRPGVFQWLLTHYLYIRIPLVHPDRFLAKSLPRVSTLFNARVRWAILLLGIWGLFRVMGQWEAFTGSFDYFFNVQGLVAFGFTVFFLKVCHELGHAYTAKAMGCKIPTMGLAFLVLYPMLYTDTTDAWRLPRSRQRLSISLAGVKTELYMALLATWIWSFLPPGILKSAAFFIAAVGWVGSLFVNLSPFMRFDGYYALSDWLGEDNLQPRAFALARWQIRQWIPRLSAAPPEVLPTRRHYFFLVYALATWIYRFFLFLGIALLVYHATFKLLGILLFCVEICWFILLPLGKELKYWWAHRKEIPPRQYRYAMPGAILLVLIFLCIPWQEEVQIPGVFTARDTAYIYPRESAMVAGLYEKEGETVEKDTPVLRLWQPDLDFQRRQLDIHLNLAQTLMDRSTASERTLIQSIILKRQWEGYKAAEEDLVKRKQDLTLTAPFSGILNTFPPLTAGQWCPKDQALAMLIDPKRAIIHAYLSEEELHGIRPGQKGKFYASHGSSPWVSVTVARVDQRAVHHLPDPLLASVHGGPIPARRDSRDKIRPETALYQVLLETSAPAPAWETPGRVRIQCERRSIAQRLRRKLAGLLIRESGF